MIPSSGHTAPHSRAILVERLDIAPDLAIFKLRCEADPPAFVPGQFMLLGLADGRTKVLWRAYSIASAPSSSEFVEFYIRRVTGGAQRHLTEELWRLKRGDFVYTRPARGNFKLERQHPDGTCDKRRTLLVAAGTGLAPFVSFIRQSTSDGAHTKIVLCHGARFANELGYTTLLRNLAARHGPAAGSRFELDYLPTISRPTDPANHDWRGYTGRVETLLDRSRQNELSPAEQHTGEPFTPRNTMVYVCGPRGTIDAVLERMTARGFRPRSAPHPDGHFDIAVEAYG